MCVFLRCLLAGAVLSAAARAQDDTSPAKRLETAALLALANQDSFDSFVCQFELESGTIESMEALERGELSDTTVVGAGLWARNQEEQVFRIYATDNFTMTPLLFGGEKMMMAPFTPEVIVANSTYSLKLTSVLSGGVISERHKAEKTFLKYSPWHTLGIMGTGTVHHPAAYLLECIEPANGSISKLEDVDGVLIASGSFDGLQQEIRIDTARGHVPVSFTFRLPDSFAEFRVTDTIEKPGIGHFPSSLIGTSAEKFPASGQRLRVTQLEVREPTDEELTFTADQCLSVYADSTLSNKLTHVGPGDTITPSQLGTLYAAAAAGNAKAPIIFCRSSL